MRHERVWHDVGITTGDKLWEEDAMICHARRARDESHDIREYPAIMVVMTARANELGITDSVQAALESVHKDGHAKRTTKQLETNQHCGQK